MKLLAVHDGRAGMRNQALGLAEAMARLRQAEIVEHNTKTGMAPAADIVIGCGRAALPVLRGADAFTVYVQDPRKSHADFDVIVAPEHDGLAGANVVTTLGAPNRVTRERLEAAAVEFAPHMVANPRPRAAVLIGGRSKRHRLDAAAHDVHIAAIKRLRAAGYSTMVSTSRRTPERIVADYRDRAADGRLWLYDGEGPNPYLALLGGADVILVTEDSTNMLTEACATGTPVLRLPMSGKPGKLAALYEALLIRCGVRPWLGYVPEPTPYLPLDETAQAAVEIWARYPGP